MPKGKPAGKRVTLCLGTHKDLPNRKPEAVARYQVQVEINRLPLNSVNFQALSVMLLLIFEYDS